jgi:hypothetical protein
MIGPAQVLSHISRAEEYVREARKLWDPTSIDCCTECAEALRLAISEMESACTAAAAAPPVPGAKTRLRRLRNDVDVLAQWVDAAMAFARGLALRTATEELAHADVKG